MPSLLYTDFCVHLAFFLTRFLQFTQKVPTCTLPVLCEAKFSFHWTTHVGMKTLFILFSSGMALNAFLATFFWKAIIPHLQLYQLNGQ